MKSCTVSSQGIYTSYLLWYFDSIFKVEIENKKCIGLNSKFSEYDYKLYLSFQVHW